MMTASLNFPGLQLHIQ